MRALVAIASLVLLASCSSVQWGRFKAHGSAVTVGVLAGAAAVATGGTAGLLIAGGGVATGVIVDQTLEPEPEVHVKRVTVVVQVPAPAEDGTPRPPSVRSYVDEEQHAAPAGLPGLGDLPTPVGFWERVWRAVQFVWWVCLVLFVLGWLVLHRASLWRQERAGARARPSGRVPPGAPPPER